MQKPILLKMTVLGSGLACALMSIAPLAAANDLWSTDRQYLTGDWQGTRTQLEQEGYKFNLNVMNQTATVLDGGKADRHSTQNANQVLLGAAFDLEKIAGLKDTSAVVSVTKRDGRSLANEIDMSGNPTEIYGRGNIWRLTQAWVKTGWLQNQLQVKAGRMGMSEDFNGSQCEFQSLILCGGQIGKSQGAVWYNSPVSGWALNAKYQFAPEWTIGAGIYENNPDNLRTDKKTNFNLDTDAAEGVMIPIELAWKTKQVNGLAGEYKLGGFYTTHDYAKVGHQSGEDSKNSLWLNVQQRLSAPVEQSNRGLYGAMNLVFNDQSTAAISATQQLAFWYKGAFDARPQDQIGFGAGRYVYNQRIDSNQMRDAEVDFELNYVYQYSPAIMIRPNLQYVKHPKGLASTDDTWLAGLSVRLQF